MNFIQWIKKSSDSDLSRMATECLALSKMRLSCLLTGEGIEMIDKAKKMLPHIEREMRKRNMLSYLKVL